jgi:ubiquinone/menaquinone biosynthesis C-methylase UbiE
MTETKLHSEIYFNELRDYWWNQDFLQLMAQRWDFKNVESILDVGCGQGHWGRLLLKLSERPMTLHGVDSEPKWIEVAREKAAPFSPKHQLHYQMARAEKLPFPDESFDMVTCQTVLIHVKDPMIAIQEMLRVLKPGGLMVAAEPNNAAPGMSINNLTMEDSALEHADFIKFQLICEKGKEALGEGNNMRGDLIPYYFFKSGVKHISSYLSDMADYYIPPYDSHREQAGIQSILEAVEHFIWDKEDTHRYFRAGGGTESEFQIHWENILKSNKDAADAIKKKELCLPGGAFFYLISGRKNKDLKSPTLKPRAPGELVFGKVLCIGLVQPIS